MRLPLEIPLPDEVEVYRTLQDCIEMRKKSVFKEFVAPWEKEIVSDPDHILEGKTDHYFEMKDGVVHVYANKDSKEKLFPVGDATTFFTDLHHVLKVIAAGNIRTLRHHRNSTFIRCLTQIENSWLRKVRLLYSEMGHI